MSGSQKWIGIILAAFVILFILVKVLPLNETPGDETDTTPDDNYSTESTIDVSSIIEDEGCYVCHGEDFAGSDNAPALKNLSSKYTAGALTVYLKNPVKTSKVEYPMEMPGIEDLDDASVKALAEYLLKL